MNDRIEDIYPLAPGQGGILFNSLGGGAPGDYVIQLVLDLRGDPDPAREAAAWQALVARHAVLRTAFVWKGQKHPLQVVGRHAVIRPQITDLGDLPETGRQARLRDWLAADRLAGFDLSRAPLLRVNRFALGSRRHRVVVSFHHAVIDGWSIPILLRDWVALYAGRDLPPALPFRDHVAWALAQDRDAALDFWRAELAGRTAPALILPAPATPPATTRGDIATTLPEGRIPAAARRSGITPATLLHGAWAMLMAQVAGTGDIVYGLARAGRPAALSGAETRVGMFLNTLPVRARIDAAQPLSHWLRALQDRQQAQAAHEYVTLAEVQAVTRLPGGGALLDSAVVFENYPRDPSLLGHLPGLTIDSVEVLEQTSLGLTLFVVIRDRIELRLVFDAARIDAGAAQGLLDDLCRILAAFEAQPDRPLGTIALNSRGVVPPRREGATVPAAAPATDMLPALRRIWQQVLDVAPPDPDENFFDLGGHSLLVLTLQDRIRRDLAVEVEIPDLFRFATLTAQAGHLARLRANPGPADADMPRDRATARGDARTAGQQRMQQRRAQTTIRKRTEDA